jgi:hypothetical protein
LEKWAAGDFTTGESKISKPINLISPSDQAHELERAALEVCVGGPFYPGIEMTYISAYKSTYKSPFRLSDDFGPGDVTKYMAIPWQADFFECNTHWWPAQRPDDVVPEMEYMSVLNSWNNESKDDTYAKSDPFADALGDHVQWARGLGKDIGSSHAGDDDMVKYWHELGFVVPKKTPNGEIVQVETEREQFAGLDVRELFYQLMNENYKALPKARQYVEDSLAAARDYMVQPDTPETWRPFKYSEQAFTARMNEIYNDMVNDVDRYDPATDATFRNRADIVERIKQFSPFNMSDGCWLRHMAKAGPMDHPHSLLFSVLMDEMGDGVVGHNHSNIYQDLCHSTGYYPYPMSSRKFAFDESLIESGFQLPVFELAASACTEAYFPELLGMTLQLEWGIYEAKKTIALLEYYGFDTHYYVMHVGIDNPSNGHAARAVEAISIYLDNVRAQHGGEQAVQEQWSRIWAGFVTFGTIGTFGQDLVNHLKDKPTLEARMLQLITDKAAYGSLNHGDKKLGPNKINDWFSDPKGFLNEIQKSGLVVPGDWENSPMNALTSFSTGKMYRVFTPEELQLWIDWTNSLVDKKPPVGFDAKQNMIQLINVLRQRQEGVEGHQLAMLKGPKQDEGKSVAWWFDQPTGDFMQALIDPRNKYITPGSLNDSPFLNDLLAPSNPMGEVFANVVVGTGGKTGRDIVKDWISADCPTPPKQKGQRKILWLSTSQNVWDEHPNPKIRGLGAIH